MDAARSVLSNLSPRGKLALGGAALAIVLLLYLVVHMATRTSYETLTSGLDPAETGKVTAALDEKGIGYELRNGGTAVAVPDSDLDQARIALAESDAVGGAKPGFELFEKQQFGASDFQQKVTYQRALEGELERTISQVDGVSGATVQLTLPEDQLFAAESVKPTAAVMLEATPGSLDSAAVRGIARLVASSVEGLDFRDVTITDSSGATLWPSAAGGGGEGISKQAIEARYEHELEARLTALLARTIGPNKGRVQVQADIDANHTTESSLRYAKRGTPLQQNTETESLAGAGAGPAGGAAGAAGNIPSYAAGAAGAGNSRYRRKTDETQFGVDKTVTRTRIAPGGVNRQDVALVVDKSVPPAEVAQLQRAVAAAAGIDRRRGDTITTSRIDFAQPPAPPGPSPLSGVGDVVRYVVLGLAAAAFLFFAGRHLRRRQEEELDAEPVWLRELNAPRSLADLELAEDRGHEWEEEDTAVREDVEHVAAMDPDRVAQQLRAWMKEG